MTLAAEDVLILLRARDQASSEIARIEHDGGGTMSDPTQQEPRRIVMEHTTSPLIEQPAILRTEKPQPPEPPKPEAQPPAPPQPEVTVTTTVKPPEPEKPE